MSSKREQASVQNYKFIVVGGGIAGVTCVETVSFLLNIFVLVCFTENSFTKFCIFVQETANKLLSIELRQLIFSFESCGSVHCACID